MFSTEHGEARLQEVQSRLPHGLSAGGVAYDLSDRLPCALANPFPEAKAVFQLVLQLFDLTSLRFHRTRGAAIEGGHVSRQVRQQ